MVPFIWQNVGVLWECCGVWPIELLSTWVRSGTPKETCHCACCIRRRQKRPHENHSIPPRIPTSLGPHEVLGYRNFVKLPLFTQPWTRRPLYPTPSHNCFGQKRLYKESHFSHVFGHHSNVVGFWMPPFLLLFSSLTKTEWRGLSATSNLGRCYYDLLFTRSFCKIHMTILQIHIKNHSIMMCQVQGHCACFAAGSAIRMSLKFLTGTLLDTNGLSGDGGKCFTISLNLLWWMGGWVLVALVHNKWVLFVLSL
jgi:hypothetical protein